MLRRPLSKGTTVAIWSAAVMTVLLVFATLAQVEKLCAQRAQRRATLELLHVWSARNWSSRTIDTTPRPEGAGFLYTDGICTAPDVHFSHLGAPVQDPWGHVLIFSAPGPVHRHGWDLWSVGPNGIDEQGAGDDILVGEDVADVTSR
jgi:hypothetical protein